MTRIHVLAVALVVLSAAAASAAEPLGPPFGRNSYTAAIAGGEGTPDTDDYVASLVASERLDVAVAAAKGSALLPSVTLVAPDGTVVVPAAPVLVVKKGGRAVTLRKFLVPATGRWAVRVAGAQGTEGAYSVAFGVAGAPATSVKRAPILGPADVVRPFDAVEGARVEIDVRWRDPRAAVQFRGVFDPSNRLVAGLVPVAKAKSVSVRGVLHGGDGAYALHLGNAGTSVQASYDLTVRVTPLGRPSAKKPVALTSAEPLLAERAEPLRGVAGMTLRLEGARFDPSAPPRVVFGNETIPATVAPDGLSLGVVVPDGLEGSTADVAVVARDGQASVRPHYFHYAESVVVGELVGASGVPVRMLGVGGGDVLEVRGAWFEEGQRVFFGSTEAAVADVAPAAMHVVVPAMTGGDAQVVVRDAFGRTARSPFVVSFLAPPSLDTATAVAGPRLDDTRVALGGGATVEVVGADLGTTDTVTIGGVAAAIVSATGDRLSVVVPAGAAGPATIVVTNVLGESASLEDAIRYVGYDPSGAGGPPPDETLDDLTALRAAIADFDRDGRDDIVLASSDSPPGSRAEFTRLFFGGDDGLADVTSTHFPPAGSDPAGTDDWRATAVAASDVDGDGAPDIVIAGAPVAGDAGGDFEARLFANDGLGGFTLSENSPRVATSELDCFDVPSGLDFALFTPGGPNGARATALAVGDLDGDGMPEIVMATDRYRTATVHLPPEYVYWYGDAAYTYDAESYWSETGVEVAAPALRIFSNRVADGLGLVDVTFPRLPLAGESADDRARLPAFHGRDVKLGDVDGDGSLNLVVAWDDPATVTAGGLAAGGGAPDVATRVLLNDGTGRFTDATDAWMPAASGAEYWQANRVVLADLDGDGDLNLVLVVKDGLDAWQGAASHGASALRVLRNDGPGAGFVDVTAAALGPMPLAGTADDDLRGDALLVADFDGDGRPDVFVATTEALTDAAGVPMRSTRLLRGAGGLAFAPAGDFLPPAGTDSAEADDLVACGASPGGTPSLVLVTETPPRRTASGRSLRTFAWQE